MSILYNPPSPDFADLYARFDAPICDFDCGKACAPFNPTGKPFCCDICQAVPAAFRPEWDFLQKNTALWHIWRGDECAAETTKPEELRAETPEHMLLLACQGPLHCQRDYRAVSCRQFPFFPYITSRDRFLGLAYEWEFETSCWVINHLEAVTSLYRRQFIQTYEALFALWEEEFDSYALHSEDMRAYFSSQNRRLPLLHRNGGYYLLSPATERIERCDPLKFKRFGPYTE
ncbi:MAG: hypothetical protein LWX83_11365 [Anaerolineae bacterium]|nr:hypothetical protein [Anaerolineae bacterium]